MEQTREIDMAAGVSGAGVSGAGWKHLDELSHGEDRLECVSREGPPSTNYDE